MKIYLVRHGEVNSNLKSIYNYKEEGLNETGIKQATELKSKIELIDYDIIFSSPLLRAVETAEIVNCKNNKIVIDSRLREREWNDLTGKSTSVTDREEIWNYYTELDYGKEERIPELCARVKAFIDELKEKEYKNVLVVAHSGISKAFYVYFNGIPKDGRLLDKGLKNGEVKEYNL